MQFKHPFPQYTHLNSKLAFLTYPSKQLQFIELFLYGYSSEQTLSHFPPYI